MKPSSKKQTKSKLFGMAVGVVLFFGLSYMVLIMVSHIPVKAPIQATNVDGEYDIGSKRINLHGTIVCLPHTYPDGTQTKECALGIKSEKGDYYALDFSVLETIAPPYKNGDHLIANGLYTPVEMLSANFWDRYPIKGIFSVTDSLEIKTK